MEDDDERTELERRLDEAMFIWAYEMYLRTSSAEKMDPVEIKRTELRLDILAEEIRSLQMRIIGASDKSGIG